MSMQKGEGGLFTDGSQAAYDEAFRDKAEELVGDTGIFVSGEGLVVDEIVDQRQLLDSLPMESAYDEAARRNIKLDDFLEG